MTQKKTYNSINQTWFKILFLFHFSFFYSVYYSKCVFSQTYSDHEIDTLDQNGKSVPYDSDGELFFHKLNEKLDPHGVQFALSWTGETAGIVRGGRRKGVDYAHQIAFSVDMDWEKIAGFKGFSTHAMILNLAGRNASSDYVGDSQIQAQEIYGGGYDRLFHMNYIYIEQQLWKDQVNIRAGRLSVGNEFASSPFACQFMLIATCGQPRSIQSQQGFTPWPGTVWGIRFLFHLTKQSYFQLGAYESSPWGTGKGGVAGFDWSTNAATGVFMPIEYSYNPEFGKDKLTGYYHIGAGLDTSRFQTWSAQAVNGNKKDNRSQFWVMMDQMIFRNDPKKDHGLYLILNYGHDSTTTSTFKDLYNVGFINKGFWKKRPYDQIGFMFTYYTVPKSLKHAQKYQMTQLSSPFNAKVLSLLNGAPAAQTNSALFELNYGISAYRGVMVMPVVEYFHHVAATKAYKDAFVIGLKTNINF